MKMYSDGIILRQATEEELEAVVRVKRRHFITAKEMIELENGVILVSTEIDTGLLSHIRDGRKNTWMHSQQKGRVYFDTKATLDNGEWVQIIKSDAITYRPLTQEDRVISYVNGEPVAEVLDSECTEKIDKYYGLMGYIPLTRATAE